MGSEVKGGAIFFQPFVCCSFSVFRSSSKNWLFIDLNRTSKERVHVRELTHQAREFLLEKSNKLYQQLRVGGIEPCFKLRGQ